MIISLAYGAGLRIGEVINLKAKSIKSDFERKGNHWLELTRNWILEANQAKNLALQDNFSKMKNFLKKIGLNCCLAAGRLEIDFKKPFDLLANLPSAARAKAKAWLKTHQI